MTAPAMSESAVGQLEAIVRDERSALLQLARETRIATVLLPLLSAAAVGIPVLGGSRWLVLPRIVPFVIWAAAIGAAVWVWRRRRSEAERRTAPDAVAESIETEQRLRRGALRVAREVDESGPLGAYAAATTSSALSGTRAPRAPKSFRMMRDQRQRILLWTAGALVAMLGASAIWRDGAAALANPIGAWNGSLLPALVLEAPSIALRGSTPTVRVSGVGRDALTLEIRKLDGKVLVETIAIRGDRGERTLPVLDDDVTLVISDGRASTAPHRVRVTDKPYLGDVVVQASYPAYLGRVDEDVALAGVLVLPRGTVLTLRARASVP